MPKVPFAVTGVLCCQLFPELLRTVGYTANTCPQRIFKKHGLKGQGCPSRAAKQIFLVFYTPNKTEKANKHSQSDPQENRCGSYERWGVIFPVQLGKILSERIIT